MAPDDDPALHDEDPEETREWLQALQAVVAGAGPERGRFLVEQLEQQAQELGIVPHLQPFSAYRNTITLERQEPGGQRLGRRRVRGFQRLVQQIQHAIEPR